MMVMMDNVQRSELMIMMKVITMFMMMMMIENLVNDMNNVQRPDKENATFIGCVRRNLQKIIMISLTCNSAIWCYDILLIFSYASSSTLHPRQQVSG